MMREKSTHHALKIYASWKLILLKGVPRIHLCHPAMSDLSTEQRKAWARDLFVHHNYTQKQIAEKVGVTEKTIGAWKEKYGWEGIRESISTTSDQQIKNLYGQLKEINAAIILRDEGKRFASAKEADAISKITKSIKDLQKGVIFSDTVSVVTELIEFIRATNQSLAQSLSESADNYIKSKLR
jgi:transposase